jgi:myo-inositol 2-dehydrogenase/D-chiro-inositol 1-dehydrogenase
MSEKETKSRREFLKGSAAVAAGAALAGQVNIARMAHAEGKDVIKVALIGAGGRGTGAVENCMEADPGVKLIAVADAFENRAKGAAGHFRKNKAERTDLPDERVFVGLDAYQKAIDCGPDLIITASPPGFRPLIYSAAIKANKHVFMEKPCCVDAPGFKLLNEANAMADQKGLRVVVGLQRRHQPNYRETIARIHDGALGKVQLLRVYWNGGGIWNRKREDGMSELMYQVHNWYHFAWVSGDNIGEQHVHNLDIANWVMSVDKDPTKPAHPVTANGMGGCLQRYKGDLKGTGQIFDEHFVEFTYADGTKMYSQCRHIPNTYGGVFEVALGTEGESNCSGNISGKNEWKFDGRGKPGNGYVNEHINLIAAIREGKPLNDGWHGAASSFTAVLGRMATYSGKEVKWDDLVAKGKSEFPTQLAWDAPAPVQKDANGDYPIPMPGQYLPY